MEAYSQVKETVLRSLKVTAIEATGEGEGRESTWDDKGRERSTEPSTSKPRRGRRGRERTAGDQREGRKSSTK